MNLNHNQDNEFDTPHRSDEYTPKKFRKIDILIFIACLVLAFVFWCYAQYIDDPIIEKEIVINLVLVGGAENEVISPSHKTVTVYGKESELAQLKTVTLNIDRTLFKEYNVSTAVTIEYPDECHSNTKQLELKLINSQKDQND